MVFGVTLNGNVESASPPSAPYRAMFDSTFDSTVARVCPFPDSANSLYEFTSLVTEWNSPDVTLMTPICARSLCVCYKAPEDERCLASSQGLGKQTGLAHEIPVGGATVATLLDEISISLNPTLVVPAPSVAKRSSFRPLTIPAQRLLGVEKST